MNEAARKRLVKRFALSLLGIALTAVVVLSLRPKPLEVETAAAAWGPLQVTIDEDGETRAHDRFTLASPVAGQLSRIDLHEGDPVEPSTVLATITPLPLDPREIAETQARIRSAEALNREAGQQVARRRSDYEQAQRDLNRAKALATSGIISSQALEQAQNAETAAAKELQAAQYRAQSTAAEVKRAEAALIALDARRDGTGKQVVIRPPAPGRILRIFEKSDRVVTAGTPLLVLSNPNRIEIVVDLLSTDAVKVRPGAPVLIERWGGPTPLRARVRLVEPYGFTKVSALGIEEQRVNVIADFVDPPDGLGDGYRVDARVVIWESPHVLKIPISALFRVGESWSVFTVEKGRAVRRLVEAGHKNAEEAEITKGLDTGAEVILHPPSELNDGARVSNRRQQRRKL